MSRLTLDPLVLSQLYRGFVASVPLPLSGLRRSRGDGVLRASGLLHLAPSDLVWKKGRGRPMLLGVGGALEFEEKRSQGWPPDPTCLSTQPLG